MDNPERFKLLPSACYRYFTDLEHAMTFMNGHIRLGSLNGYRACSDANRTDEEELTARIRFRADGPDSADAAEPSLLRDHGRSGEEMGATGEDITPTYALCCSLCNGENGSWKAARFGKYRVTIHDPVRFIELLDLAFREDYAARYFLQGGPVTYADVLYKPREPKPHEWDHATLYTKRTRYLQEQEYRFLYRLDLLTLMRGYGSARTRFDPPHIWTAIPVTDGLFRLAELS